MTPSVSTLFVGDRLASRCVGGRLEVEYVLFDRAEVMLSTGTGQGVREAGYLTSASFARARLNAALVTADLAYESFGALRARGLESLARSRAVARSLEKLGPIEAFEGGELDASRGRYKGVWLDLDALAGACGVRDAALLLQALHLIVLLEEVPDDSPVRLLTGLDEDDTALAGERTWRRIALEGAQRLPWILRELPSTSSRLDTSSHDESEVREGILRSVRGRATASSVAQPRLEELAWAIARPSAPPPGAHDDADAPQTERMPPRPPPPPRPSPRPPRPASVRPGGSTLRTDDLRSHAARLRGDDRLREVASSLSALADGPGASADLKLLAARAWLAAGELAYARHFARALADDLACADDIRAAARELLGAVPKTNDSSAPPPTAPIQPDRVIVLETVATAPPGASLPPMAPEPVAPAEAHEAFVAEAVSLPLHRPEIVETLGLPPGLSEDLLPVGGIPRDPDQARVAMTRLARQLAREYRLAYGTTLKTDVVAIDAMQRHLRRRQPEGEIDEKHRGQLEVELMRHGALLGEILARRLGARWIDLTGDEPGRWAMLLRPDVRVWPIGRVYRFFWRGHREADLVAYYGDLEASLRQ